jgi:hypothetical protein
VVELPPAIEEADHQSQHEEKADYNTDEAPIDRASVDMPRGSDLYTV